MKIFKINEKSTKQKIAKDILNSLPEWFGIESAILEYVDAVADLDFFAASDDKEFIGFITVKFLFNNVANLHVLGIKEKYHNKGIGTKLFNEAEKLAKEFKCEYITVYTLSPSARSEPYLKTIKFYKSLGFTSLYESNRIWDKHNPFLLMVKYIDGNNADQS